MSATCILFCLYKFCHMTYNFTIDLIHFFYIISKFWRHLKKILAQTLLSFKILLHGINQFLHTADFIFKYSIINCYNGVCHICRTNQKGSGIIMTYTTLLHRFSIINTIVHHIGRKHCRKHSGMNGYYPVMIDNDFFVEVIQLVLHCLNNLLAVFKCGNITGLWSRLSFRQIVVSIMHGKLDNLSTIHIDCQRCSICRTLSRMRLYASYDCPVSCFF